MILRVLLAGFALVALGCASGGGYDDAMLEKYPKCYHQNVKIYQTCVSKNEAGEKVTALQLENSAFPGQYKN